ncbi:MAG: hypothetical protein P8Y13_01295 [Deinococcales bacterium]
MVETVWETFLWAAGGGLAAEALRWWRLVRGQQQGATINLPVYARSPLYWGLTAAIVLAGGMLAVAYVSSGQRLGPILAVNVGASAPLIIQGLAASAPSGVEPSVARGAPPADRAAGRYALPSVGNFLRGR